VDSKKVKIVTFTATKMAALPGRLRNAFGGAGMFPKSEIEKRG
jgi:hypothetical protein